MAICFLCKGFRERWRRVLVGERIGEAGRAGEETGQKLEGVGTADGAFH